MNGRRSLGALIVLTAITLAGCGSDPAEAPRTVTGPNQADTAFATQMIQHHAQALAMVDLTLGRNLRPKTAALAERIRAAQAPEIETMADWLTGWGEPVPETSRDHANAEGHADPAHSELPGMLSESQLRALEHADKASFERLWLTSMIEQHQGAIEIAQAELDEGQDPAALALAAKIQASQTDQIDRMKSLLAR